MWWNDTDIKELIGKTFSSVRDIDGATLLFETENGEGYKLYHCQDCCENVFIEDIVGDLEDLVGTPILTAEEVYSEEAPLNEYEESYTWTFYKFSTIRGNVTVRWYGSSNGYYSERVDFVKVA